MPHGSPVLRSLAATALLLAAACERPQPPPAAAVQVDSARPGAEALARFRAGLPRVSQLGAGSAPARDSLVARFVTALENADSAAFAPLSLDAGEFAWLYYETDPQARPPYELPPEIMWGQSREQGARGLARALQRYGGRPLGFAGYACAREQQRGPNRVWLDCRVRLLQAGERGEVRLFGGIVERQGRYKFLSYANEL